MALLGLLLGQTSLQADDVWRWGLQAGVSVAASPDLRLTTRSGLNPTLGLRVEWGSEDPVSRDQQTWRFRLDADRFREGRQVSDASGLRQEITTKVRDESLGAEYIFYQDRWSLGAGLYAIRWTVDSTNHLETSAGSMAAASSSSWTRMGLGFIAGRRWTKHLETELRFVSSHYGQENQPTSLVSLNFVWTF